MKISSDNFIYIKRTKDSKGVIHVGPSTSEDLYYGYRLVGASIIHVNTRYSRSSNTDGNQILN